MNISAFDRAPDRIENPRATMRICLFTNSYLPKVGGMELAVHYLANALSARGCRVTVIGRYAKGQIHLARRYTLIRFGNRFPLSGSAGLDALGAIIALIRAHHRQSFDLVHCHGVSHAGSRVYFAKKSGLFNRPVIMTPHGQDIQKVPEVNYGLRLKPRWDRIIRRNLKAADRVTALSTSITKQLDFIDPEKIHIIPNGIHLSEFQTDEKDFLHRYLELPADRKIVLSVGRHRKVKGYEYGVRAFKLLMDEHPDLPLNYVLIGKDTHLLQPLVDRLGLRGRVWTIPQMSRENIVRGYASAWCFLSPSLSEGLSLVSIEAMASGIPLVVTDVPGNMDIVQSNGCGLIVNAGKPDAIARGLKHLVWQPSEHQLFSRRSRERAPGYDWMKIAERYQQEYRLAMAAGPVPAGRARTDP
jgi:glycosyltransferase involved in cell wall biosynthesis